MYIYPLNMLAIKLTTTCQNRCSGSEPYQYVGECKLKALVCLIPTSVILSL